MSPQIVPTADGMLDTRIAGRFLGVAPKTLANWRVLGVGPAVRRHGGRILYARVDLEKWSAARTFHSTSEADAAAA
ncbi:MAG: helix-turn-helix domain-containing protein [Gemmatimonas sp.]